MRVPFVSSRSQPGQLRWARALLFTPKTPCNGTRASSRAPSGPDRRVQVRFCPAPEEGVLTIEERKAVLRGLQQVDEPKHPEKKRRAAEASLSAPEGSLTLCCQ